VSASRAETKSEKLVQAPESTPFLQVGVTGPPLDLLGSWVLKQLSQLEGGLHYLFAAQDTGSRHRIRPLFLMVANNSELRLRLFDGWSTWKPGKGLMSLKYGHILKSSWTCVFSAGKDRADWAYPKNSRIFVIAVLPYFLRLIILADFLPNSTEISLYTVVPNLLNSPS
jgi:hypothetical protein